MGDHNRHEQEPRLAPHNVLDLSTIRKLIDHKVQGSTKNSRTTSLLEYFFEISKPLTVDEDPLYSFERFLPPSLGSFTVDHEALIDDLLRQDSKDYYSDRFDLHEVTAQFSESAWMQTSLEACRIMSINPELDRANVTLRLIYRDAYFTYIDDVVDRRKESRQATTHYAA